MTATSVRVSQLTNVPVGTPAVNLPVILRADNTEAAFTNSAAENTLWSYSIPAGTLGANDALIFDAWQSILNNSGGLRTLTFRLKLGVTTLLTIAPTISASATIFSNRFRAMIKNAGATNSQKAAGEVLGATNAIMNAYGTAAIDLTLAAILALTVQADAATATQTYTELFTELQYLHAT